MSTTKNAARAAAKDEAPTRLTELQVENYKKIVFLDLKLRHGITEISGRNGAGKSSALDAVAVWLDGLKVAPVEPIRQGAERSRIRGRLGEMFVTRTLRRMKSGNVTNDITFQPIEGKPYPATQKMLDDLIGEHRLDPLDFIALDRKGKFAEFQAFVSGFDFVTAGREHAGEYSRRTDVNRLAKEARAAESLIIVPKGLPEEPVDESALVQQLREAGEHNVAEANRAANRNAAIQKVADLRAAAAAIPAAADEQIAHEMDAHDRAVSDIRKQIEALEEKILDVSMGAQARITEIRRAAKATAESSVTAADDLQARIDASKPAEEINTSELMARIDKARETNAALTRLADKRRHANVAAKYEAESAELTASIKAREAAREKAIAEAKLPIAGIEFGDEEILLNGVPFDQASTAQKLAVAMALIVARSPKLRLAWIRDASLLDDDSYTEMARLAAEYQCDILIETVRPIGKDAVVLEDGRVKAEEAA